MRQLTRADMETIDSDEVLLGTIYKHPLGIIIVYLQAALGLVLSIGLAFVLLPTVVTNAAVAFDIAVTFALVVLVFAATIVIVSTIIYRQSHLIITDKNITQVLQSGLFKRKISQLTMANVEDVTSEQNGIFQSIFDYGTLKIETAGEQANFHFSYCPKPSYYAKIILEAREKYTAKEYPYASAVKGNL
ncbi:hypothetical protein EB118_04540 [bacterium]|nr:hypothetical protein [bacterium]NBX97662.1 hypothetical protein [bacterium]NDC94135.1 hypothetical protein [bacterium]NDD83132.1 hypothetical protein [bacterium]NDG29355.1 hypothetical protein [bacterium]